MRPHPEPPIWATGIATNSPISATFSEAVQSSTITFALADFDITAPNVGGFIISIADEARADLVELLEIPANYKVLFLQGGASQQFATVPMNFLQVGKSADYILTGAWSEKAVSEAKVVGSARIASSPAIWTMPNRRFGR